MKTKVFYLVSKAAVVVVLAIVLAVKAFAGSGPKLSLIPFAKERALIAVENLSDVPSELLIEDAEGNVVYFKEGSLNEDFYSKKFDFKNLRDGEYKIVLKNGAGEHVLPFKVVDSHIVVSKSYKDGDPFFEVKNGVLKLSMLNHANEEVKLSIVDENGVFFSKTLGNGFSITTGLRIDNLRNGDYSVEIEKGDKTYSYNFAK